MTIASDLELILEAAIGAAPPLRIHAWDGSSAGDPTAEAGLTFTSPRALRRILYAPNELGLARAFVAGELEVDGDPFAVLDMPEVIAQVARHRPVGLSARQRASALRAAAALGALGLPPRPPAEESRRRRGRLHSIGRDSDSVSHHYDVSNDFYRMVLGPSMAYSCALWAQAPGPDYGLDDAQRDKCELICAKLGLRPGMRLLDVGCGWGTLAIHAAAEHGAQVLGVTLSAEQARLARQRVDEAGMSKLVEIRVQDYREVTDGPFDAIASIGMAEHVGADHLEGYFRHLEALLRPGGRLLNHAIASVRAIPRVGRRDGFIDRYIFPDGQIVALSSMLDAVEHTELEVRDVEGLREHYGLTLRAWVANLLASWDEAVQVVTPERVRAWLLYLAVSALGFEHGNLTVHQVLAVRQGERGSSGMPRTRAEWMDPSATNTSTIERR